MMKALVLTGNIDFTAANSGKKYKVPIETTHLVADILDDNKLEGEPRYEMDIVLRHFSFC